MVEQILFFVFQACAEPERDSSCTDRFTVGTKRFLEILLFFEECVGIFDQSRHFVVKQIMA